MAGWEKIEEVVDPEDQEFVGKYSLTVSSARLRVHGGWLVRTIVTRYEAGASVSMEFVEDQFHNWSLSDPPAVKE